MTARSWCGIRTKVRWVPHASHYEVRDAKTGQANSGASASALRCYFKSARASVEWRHNFDVSANPSSTGLGAYFRHMGTERICAGRLAYTTWTLDIAAPGFRRAAVQELARYYVG